MISEADLNFFKCFLVPAMSCWQVEYGIRNCYILKLKDSIYITKFNHALYNPKDGTHSFSDISQDTLAYICINLGKRYDL